ncbi:reverse transcriptase, partial [Tanacetum coccineum]
MRKIISPQQSTFIPGRQIQDSIVVANEAFHYIRNKKNGEQSVMALKIYLNKAFDRVEWDFLFAVLRKMGFGDVWCGWIRACLTTYKLEFMVNGDSVGVIKPQRGLRQGDPISPYLFIIIADVLSRQILKAMSLGTISALRVQQMDSKAKYLGLPLIFGQKKTEMFGFLLEKVLQKMQGW